ncbi:PLP-dependent aminotransferase family protein [Alcaligenes phenolicus]|uniref:PLP-dependent aminotransferase family protein n=1 Tax=Alcaligenes phenolicus TaxID=232846 RepID=A0AAW5VPN3_9BURK|nr:PLP-dependent aminotransferase family protein [Alcaligenes phenolicus]MCX5565083.1 PLP-dependent aminotransferase family protein [Alcaligenes phenolicus]
MSALTRIDHIMQSVRERIAARTYPPGTRLPSVRAQAKSASVSVSTIVEAYGRLAAEGLIEARVGSGFYVTAPLAPLSLAALEPALEKDIDPLWISRQSLEADADVLMPGCGWLPSDWMYDHGVRRGLRKAARSPSADLTDYGSPLGLEPLRQMLARRLVQSEIDAAPHHIMLTDSGTQAIDLLCRFFLEPGDTVLVDDPCYFNFHALLRAHRAKIASVPYTHQGPDLAAFEAALQEHKPRLYITNSGIHNPTGARLSAMTAHSVLAMAQRADLYIIEDDIFGDLETRPATRLAALDGLSRVVQIGSFSKTLSAALRCGYIAAQTPWIESLVDLRTATSFSSNRLASHILNSALGDSGYRKHLERVRYRLSKAMDHTVTQLEQLGLTPWLRPREGMFLWVRLPTGHDALSLTRACLPHGVVLAPGPVFSQAPDAAQFLRFNVAQCGDKRVFSVLKRALNKELSV